jgi:DNA-binding response OmpR family regulator
MSAAPNVAARPARILIVDDARDNRELLEVMLNWEGFVTQSAASGEEALAFIAQEPPDLVLLDLALPGMNGHDLTLRLQADATTEHIPIIIISGRGDDATRKRTRAAGATDFILKPIGRADLSERVRNALLFAKPSNATARLRPSA